MVIPGRRGRFSAMVKGWNTTKTDLLLCELPFLGYPLEVGKSVVMTTKSGKIMEYFIRILFFRKNA